MKVVSIGPGPTVPEKTVIISLSFKELGELLCGLEDSEYESSDLSKLEDELLVVYNKGIS